MSECDVLKVEFSQERIPFRVKSTKYYLKQTAKDMLHIMKTPERKQSTMLIFGEPVVNAQNEIAHLLGHTPPVTSADVPPPKVETTEAYRIPHL